MTSKVLGGGSLDGSLGLNPDFSTLTIPLGRVVQSVDNEGYIQYWIIEETLKAGGNALANGLYANSTTLKEVAGGVSKLSVQNRQAIEATYKAQGYNNVFFFEDGFTYTESNDVGIYEDGTAWTYADAGALPVTITAGTVPSEGVYLKVNSSSNGLPAYSSPAIIDMHFGPLKGYGFADSESGGEYKIYNVSSGVSKGSVSLSTTVVSDIVANQLLAFKSSDGTYFSGVVKSINGTSIIMKDGLEGDVDAGDNLFNFYKNVSHPTTIGYRAIADFSLKEVMYTEKFITKVDPEPCNGGVVSANTSNSYANPGAPSSNGWSVQASGLSDGCRYSLGDNLKSGSYRVYLPINVGQNNSLFAILKSKTGGLTVWSNSQLTKEDSGRIYIDLFIFKSEEYVLEISSPSGGDTFFTGSVVVTEKINRLPKLNQGRHLMLGDSWFAQGPLVERLSDRLPNAKVINKGVGGNTAQNISNRFDSDVTPENPDFVWLMTGTNDYYQGVTLDIFNYYIAKIKSQCTQIGAQLIIFSNSVGSSGSGDLFSSSRDMAYGSYAMDGVGEVGSSLYRESFVSLPTTKVEAGEVVYFGFQGFIGDKAVTVNERYFTHDISIVSGTTQVVGIGFVDEVIEVPSGYALHPIAGTATAGRWLFLRYENTSESQVSINGYANLSIEI